MKLYDFTAHIDPIPYIGNLPQRKQFENFLNLEAFANVFLHFLSQQEFLYHIAGYFQKVKFLKISQ